MTRILMAIDQGTTGTTVSLVDETMRVLGTTNVEFPQHYPKPGWVEHDPEQIWDSVLHAIAGATEAAGVRGEDIAAIGITNQRETTLLWERATGRPVARAIVWQCRRTAPMCEALVEEGHAQRIRELTGLVVDAYFSGTKLRWLLDEVPGARARAERGELAAGTIDTFLVWRLTGGAAHVTDASNASRTMLMGLRSLAWEDELLDLLGVPRNILPEIRGCAEVYGHTRGVPGLPDGIPIAGMAGDQQAALFGQACFAPGEAKITYGTGAFLLVNTGSEPTPSRNRLVTTVAWKLGGDVTYALEGSAFIAGAAVQWLRDGLGIIRSAPEVEPLARQVPDSGGVVFVPAFVGLGAPHWRPQARGALLGLTRGTTRAHIARACLDGIALQNVDILRAMDADRGEPVRVIKVDGGACRNDLLMQIQADVAGVEVIRPAHVETTSLGAVFLAGLGAGIWHGLDEVRRVWREERRFVPAIDEATRRAMLDRWAEAVQRA